ncbi:MAG TPA: hypothetical protein VG847_12705 [Chitinophagaceae bacterium]|nr:hypothetical protein [Chitinophagaceae bacterium]
MTEEPIMTEKESMELTTSMINKAKNNFGERGLLYLIWGWVILFCCLVSFAGNYFFNFDKINFIWLVVYLVIIFQGFYIRKKRSSALTRTYTGEINGYVWLVFVVSLILMIFICNVAKQYVLIDPLLLVLYGMPTFLSGIIMKFKPLIIGGIGCWVLAALSPFINEQFSVLLIAAAVIVAWLIPGYLLKQKFEILNEGAK